MSMKQQLTEDMKEKRNILLVSPMDPYEILASSVDDEPDGPAASDEKTSATDTAVLRAAAEKREADRKWRSLLAQFRVVIVSVNKYPPNMGLLENIERGRDEPMTEDYLATELSALPELRPLRELLERELHVSEEDRAEAPTTMAAGLERIVERAYGNYMALWDACTEDEKLVLVQLANEKVVNPKQEATVRGLIQRGLLVRDPGLRVLSPSFGLFVQRVQDPDEVKSWERDAAGLSWIHARWVVLGFLSLGLLFLWATQRDLFNTTMMFLSAAAVSVPGIIKLMSNLGKVTAPGNN